jgi:hypothetical protein
VARLPPAGLARPAAGFTTPRPETSEPLTRGLFEPRRGARSGASGGSWTRRSSSRGSRAATSRW